MGVIGYGRLGTLVARILAAFGAEVDLRPPYRAADGESPAQWVERGLVVENSPVTSMCPQ